MRPNLALGTAPDVALHTRNLSYFALHCSILSRLNDISSRCNLLSTFLPRDQLSCTAANEVIVAKPILGNIPVCFAVVIPANRSLA